MTEPSAIPLAAAAEVAAATSLAWDYWCGEAVRPDSPVMGWLQSRNLDPSTVAASGISIGWARPGRASRFGAYHGLVDVLQRHGVPNRVAYAGGLMREGRYGPYPAFRDRIMLPIRHAATGDVLGVTGRLISGTQGPKYLNSPTSAAFIKGDHLFGGWEAMARFAAGSADFLVVVEGPIDVIAAAVVPGAAAVAPSGTALTVHQTEWVAAIADAADVPVVLAYDGDDPGRAASARAWGMLWPHLGERLHIANLPDGQDPGSLAPLHLRAAILGAPNSTGKAAARPGLGSPYP